MIGTNLQKIHGMHSLSWGLVSKRSTITIYKQDLIHE
jgi:hypothetical protein